jgi:muconolactone delta-isomerase
MTVNIQIGVWTGHRLDKAASQKVTAEASAASDAARVNKHLIPKDALKALSSTASAIRMHFYEKTLPWKDNGDRLLPRALYFDFMAEHNRLEQEFTTARDQFVDVIYPSAREQAAFRMGELFKADDYPMPSSLREKFYINLDIDAVTVAQDFRVDMDANTVAQIQADMTATLQARMHRAMQDVWTRLAETVGHFAEKMSTDAIFRDSTVKHLDELIAVLPGLNILNDPELEQMRQEIEGTLTGFRAADLRKDPALRKSVGDDAKAIMARMNGFMAAMGGAV